MNEDDIKSAPSTESKVKKSAKTVKPKSAAAAKATKASSKTAAEPKPKTPAKKIISAKTTSIKKTEPKVRKTRTKKLAEAAALDTAAVEKTISSKSTKTLKTPKAEKTTPKSIPEAKKKVELSPVFKKLAEPKLPSLRNENRAFLQIQSPSRAFFYWSLKPNYFQSMGKVFGSRSHEYVLAIRLVNLDTNQDEYHQVESKGSWWFDVEADSKYRAEVGFYAPHRPFVRLVFSNILETPRLKPSANTAYQPYFAVTADQFADVLDMAGFSKDAFEVYIAGDEPAAADQATQKAFVQIIENTEFDFSEINVSELRFVLFALGSGVSLEALRGQISPRLFEFLAALANQNVNSLSEEKVILALEEFFGVSAFDESEITEEFALPTVFGASSINFPKGMNKQKSNFKPSKRTFEKGKPLPLSSFSLK